MFKPIQNVCKLLHSAQCNTSFGFFVIHNEKNVFDLIHVLVVKQKYYNSAIYF